MANIKTIKGDIFEQHTQCIVNPVNCVGVMGKGLALEFKKKYPDNFKYYVEEYKKGYVRIGDMTVFDRGVDAYPRYIINFPTKNHWKDDSRIYYITDGLYSLKRFIIDNNIKSISIPALGCGLGGLNWLDVKSEIYRTLSNLDDVYITLVT